MRWSIKTLSDFIQSSSSGNNRVQIIQTKPLPQSVKVRACTIKSTKTWVSLIGKSYLPWYKNGKVPYEADAENYTVIEKVEDSTEQEIAEYTKRLGSSNQITTAYDIKIKKRLILDGCKRSSAVQDRINKGLQIPNVTVLECAGEVSSSYSIDFAHLSN